MLFLLCVCLFACLCNWFVQACVFVQNSWCQKETDESERQESTSHSLVSQLVFLLQCQTQEIRLIFRETLCFASIWKLLNSVSLLHITRDRSQRERALTKEKEQSKGQQHHPKKLKCCLLHHALHEKWIYRVWALLLSKILAKLNKKTRHLS